MNYATGDFLIRIKNAAMAKNKEVLAKSNKQIVLIAEALKKLGFLDSFKVEKGEIKVLLAFKNKLPRIMNIKLVTKPGLRIYTDVGTLEKRRSPSILLISTPLGVISSKEAVKKRTGGEVVAEIW